MVLAHNLLAMNAQRQFNITSINQKKSTEKLSSGYRINRAADDAAGLQISERMRRQIRGIDRGTDNMEDGVSWLQIGDGAMAEAQAILQRMTELSVHGANGTLSESDRQAIDAEMQQLKMELNRIHETTTFNEQRIFSDDSEIPSDIGSVAIKNLDGLADDLSIFNASYDDKTGDVTYGGIVFNGSRIPWDTIDPNMVYTDGSTQKFHEGTWVYMDGSRKLSISAKEGDEVPHIKRIFDIKANKNGLVIDDETIAWENIINEAGQSAANADYFNGTWTANYHGASLTFEVKNSYLGLNGMIEAINEGCNENRFHVYAEYSGSGEVTAVDANIAITNLRLSNDIAKTLTDGETYMIRADKDGIWLSTGKDKNSDTEVAGSRKTWADLGINSWEEGSDIRPDIRYQYSDTDGNNDTNIAFTFSLADITSVDSVVDGLDGVKLDAKNIKNYYETRLPQTQPADPNIKKITLTENTVLSLEDEVDLGRDFGQSNSEVGKNVLEEQNNSVSLSYKDAAGNDVITYTGQSTTMKSKMENDLKKYEDAILANKVMQTLAGIPDNLDLGPKDLKDLLGADKITSSGLLDDTVTITNTMKVSDASGRPVYQLKPGSEYSCGKIDFSGLNTEDKVWELVGSGFDSTCATCSKHYSFKFVLDTTGGAATADGIRYKANKSNYNNPVLEISVSSLIEKSKITGKDIAASIVDIADAVFDDHFQQYAADDNGTLYIVEPRPKSQWSHTPTFYTEPYSVENQSNYQLNLTSADNGSQNLTYTYDYGDYENQLKVEMVSDNNGGYVKKANGKGYEPFDPAIHIGAARYSIQAGYSNVDGSSTSQAGSKTLVVGGKAITVSTLGDPGSAQKTYAEQAAGKMIGATEISLNATYYTTADISGDENANIAIDAQFKAYGDALPLPDRYGYVKTDSSIQIQKSGDVPNRLMIPRFSLNTAVLGLSRTNCLTAGASRNAIDMVGRALANVSARRSLYGALQNRMEHAIKSNDNTAENTTAAESRIRDTDMAEEMVNYSKNNILAQAGQSMLAQANQSQQIVLSLLQ